MDHHDGHHHHHHGDHHHHHHGHDHHHHGQHHHHHRHEHHHEPSTPPPFGDQGFWNPAVFPAGPRGSSSSSSSSSGASCTVRVEAPLLEPRPDGAAGPSRKDLLVSLIFWAFVAGFIVYWFWLR
ncbi:hypothetical protein ACP70R_044137 [Stipagrostis hirtigluma subsp. patula]